MTDLDPLLTRAFETSPAMEANAAMARLRDTRGGDLPALSYEAVIPAGASLAQLAEALLPRLVYFLDCRGAPLPRAPGVFISLFHGDRLFFFEVHEVLEVLGAAAGATMDELIDRFGAAASNA